MSQKPHALGFFFPTGCGRLSEFPANQANASRDLASSFTGEPPARAAYSHSASVGRRNFLPVALLSQAQYFRAARKWTQSAGRPQGSESPNGLICMLSARTYSPFSPFSLLRLSSRRRAASGMSSAHVNTTYSSHRVSYRAIQIDLTSCWTSLPSAPLSAILPGGS